MAAHIPHPEEIRRGEVTVAVLVEDHPDPAGEVKLWPLAEVDETEDVDGWCRLPDLRRAWLLLRHGRGVHLFVPGR
jgi:hypothetical protein